MLCLQNAVSLVGGSTINGVSGWVKNYFCSSFRSAAISPYSKSVGGEPHISSFSLGQNSQVFKFRYYLYIEFWS